jgi:hypothetical protein
MQTITAMTTITISAEGADLERCLVWFDVGLFSNVQWV